jgi:hypothetical protein
VNARGHGGREHATNPASIAGDGRIEPLHIEVTVSVVRHRHEAGRVRRPRQRSGARRDDQSSAPELGPERYCNQQDSFCPSSLNSLPLVLADREVCQTVAVDRLLLKDSDSFCLSLILSFISAPWPIVNSPDVSRAGRLPRAPERERRGHTRVSAWGREPAGTGRSRGWQAHANSPANACAAMR